MDKQLLAAFKHFRNLVGRPSEPALLDLGQQATFLIQDISVTSNLAHQEAECGETLDIRHKQTGHFLAGDWPAWGTVVAVLWGVTAEGHSVCCRVHGFKPWCYIRVPTDGLRGEVIAELEKKRSCYRYEDEEHYNFAGFQYDAVKGERVKHKYLKVWASSVGAYNYLKKLPERLNRPHLEVVENAGVPLYAKFFSDTGLKPNGWVTARSSVDAQFHISTADWELACRMTDLTPVDSLDVAPLLLASCDIEAYSSTGAFPDASHPKDACFMINTSLRRLQQPTSEATHLCFLVDDTIDGEYRLEKRTVTDGKVYVLRFRKEVAMIQAWRDCVCVYLDADIVVWYNGYRFDLPYIYRRVLGGADPTDRDTQFDRSFQTSKFLRLIVPLKKKQQESSAMGKNEYIVPFEEHGRLTLDLYDLICKRQKMSSYSLKSVCEQFLTVRKGSVTWRRGGTAVTGTGLSQLQPGDLVQLGAEFYKLASVRDDTRADLEAIPYDLDDDITDKPLVGRVCKLDLSPHEMFRHYEKRDFGPVIDYCTRDCVAPLLLLDVLRYYMNDHQMALVTMTPVKDLWGRGAGIKGVNLVVKFAHELGFVLNQPPANPTGSYQGAFVLEPEVAFHTSPVVTLDFMSLYPSIIVSQRLCWTTVVLDPAYDNLPGIEYNTIEVAEGVSYRFACNVPNVCPELEKLLLATRRATKKQMAAATDDQLRALLDAKQLAEKVTCNAMYGLTGADTGLLKCKPLAACITAFGRQELMRTRDLVHSLQYDFYQSPLESENGKGITAGAAPSLGFHPGDPPPNKGINAGAAPSLGFHPVAAKVIYGDSVTGDTPILCRVTDFDGEMRLTYARIDELNGGFWVEKSTKEESIPLPGYEVWTEQGFTRIKRVIRHKCQKPLKRVVTRTGCVDVTTDHSLLTPQGVKVKPTEVDVGMPLLHTDLPLLPLPDDFICGIEKEDAHTLGYTFAITSNVFDSVPDNILNAPQNIREAFWNGYCDGAYAMPGNRKDKMGSAGLYFIGHSLGHRVTLKTHGGRYILNIDDDDLPTEPDSDDLIQAIEDLPPYDGYVYDLETENHHFAAGVGRMVVHNTDSVMIKFTDLPGDHSGICEAWRRGEIMAKDITERLGHGIILECEKVYCPYLLLMKKKYAGTKYEGDPARVKPKRDDKGLELAKRDTSKFCRTAQRRILDCLLGTADKVKALELVAQHMTMLCHNQVPLDDVATSKSLRDSYKGTVVQDVVNKRRKCFMPGAEFKSGERVPMVAVEGREVLAPKASDQRAPKASDQRAPKASDHTSAKYTKSKGSIVVCDIMEDVDIAKANNATIHRQYYTKDLYQKVSCILYDEIPTLDGMMKCVTNFLSSQRYMGSDCEMKTLEELLERVIQRRATGKLTCGTVKPPKVDASDFGKPSADRKQGFRALFKRKAVVKPGGAVEDNVLKWLSRG